MVVALIALFVAMGGTTYAVSSLPKRSVGSIQLKRGAVRQQNIAKGAVTMSKLATGVLAAVPAGPAGPAGPTAPVFVNQDPPSDGVSYASKAGWADKAGRADRATLADTATSATSANSATTASSAASAGSAANADKLGGQDSSFFLSRSTVVDLPRLSLTHGQTKVLLTNGPLKYTARCDIGGDGDDTADILISTTEDHTAFDGAAIRPDLLTATPEEDRLYAQVQALTGQPKFKAQDDGTAVAPGGTEVRSTVWYVGVNLFNTTGRCYFGGYAIL